MASVNPQSRSAATPTLFPHQQAAFVELQSRATAYFSGRWKNLAIKTRWHSLVVGPTASGKSAVAGMLARATNAELLTISLPSWVPVGTTDRGAKHTLAVILSHVMTYERTVLLLDEACKIFHSNPWNSYLRGEIYALLDGNWTTGLRGDESDDDDIIGHEIRTATMLRHNCYVVAAGTFQDYYDHPNPRVAGFHGGDNHTTPTDPNVETLVTKLPRELLCRFHSSPIFLPELQAADYQTLIEKAAESLPDWLVPAFRKHAARRLDQAIASKAGCRYIEAALADAIAQTSPKPESFPTSAPGDQ